MNHQLSLSRFLLPIIGVHCRAHFTSLSLLLCLTSAVLGQDGPPNRMAFQSYLTDDSSPPQPISGNREIRFQIYDEETDGDLLWGETQNVVVIDGHFSAILGLGSRINDDVNHNLSKVFKVSDSYNRFIEITVIDKDTGTMEVLNPRLRLLPSPYAFLALNALKATKIVDEEGHALISKNLANERGVNITGSVSADRFSGAMDASHLTSGLLASERIPELNASKISSGQFASDRIPQNLQHSLALSGHDGTAIKRSFRSSDGLNSTFNVAHPANQIVAIGGNELQQLRFGGFKNDGSDFTPYMSLKPSNTDNIFFPIETFVGINTQDPKAPLHINAVTENSHIKLTWGANTWSMYTTVGGSFVITQSGQPGSGVFLGATGTWQSNSDARLKEDISKLENVMDRVLKLRATSFRFKGSPANQPKALGFIAQEVEPLFPEVVAEEGTTKTMSYTSLIPVAIAAIQELHAENQSLREENVQIDRKLREMELRNNARDARTEALERLVREMTNQNASTSLMAAESNSADWVPSE